MNDSVLVNPRTEAPAADLFAWGGQKNFEVRVHGVDRIDPVVWRELRARA